MKKYTITNHNIFGWFGMGSAVLIPILLGMVYFQQIKIAKLQAHVSAVSEMNAECFSRIIQSK